MTDPRVPAPGDEARIRALLELARLPIDDLAAQDLRLFRIVSAGEALLGVGGLEACGEDALLRSVAVANEARGQGIARTIVASLEQLAANLGYRELWLLTETARDLFAHLGYEERARADAPAGVRASRQFSALCPDDATLMSRRIREGDIGPGGS